VELPTLVGTAVDSRLNRRSRFDMFTGCGLMIAAAASGDVTREYFSARSSIERADQICQLQHRRHEERSLTWHRFAHRYPFPVVHATAAAILRKIMSPSCPEWSWLINSILKANPPTWPMPTSVD
jgi:hypothetical protein